MQFPNCFGYLFTSIVFCLRTMQNTYDEYSNIYAMHYSLQIKWESKYNIYSLQIADSLHLFCAALPSVLLLKKLMSFNYFQNDATCLSSFNSSTASSTITYHHHNVPVLSLLCFCSLCSYHLQYPFFPSRFNKTILVTQDTAK